MKQTEMILDYLKRNGSITQAEAVTQLGCYRLGARIWDLKQQGHRIVRTMETGVNRFGTPVAYARYALR